MTGKLAQCNSLTFSISQTCKGLISKEDEAEGVFEKAEIIDEFSVRGRGFGLVESLDFLGRLDWHSRTMGLRNELGEGWWSWVCCCCLEAFLKGKGVLMMLVVVVAVGGWSVVCCWAGGGVGCCCSVAGTSGSQQPSGISFGWFSGLVFCGFAV